MYVAVKGGEKAIENAHRQLADERRGPPDTPELTIAQIKTQMRLACDRVMTEGSIYDLDLAALAIKQATGDLIEAIFLLRAYRTTLPRLAMSQPIDTGAMTARRRISAAFKDLPGGQVLGPTYDYTHRLLDFSLMDDAPGELDAAPGADESAMAGERQEAPSMPRVTDILANDGLLQIETRALDDKAPGDLTRAPLAFPVERDVRLQNLARGDEGFLLALGYSTQRGYGRTHPFVGEIRMGEVEVLIEPEELGFAVCIGEITVTECQTVNQFEGSATEPAQFTRGYGLSFGGAERKAMAMALVDRALRARELGEEAGAPAQDEEFVLSHSDNVEAQGFVQHLKLPHYVDFQSELALVRGLREEAERRLAEQAAEAAEAAEVIE